MTCGDGGYFVCAYDEADDSYVTVCSKVLSASYVKHENDYLGKCEPYDDGNHGEFSEEEYEELVNQRRTVISYWTPERIHNAVPLHNGVGIFGRRKQRKLQAITNDEWNHGGDVVEAMGILLFTKGGINRRCSATAITDGSTDGQSLILTAAHCVYDDNANSVSLRPASQ